MKVKHDANIIVKEEEYVHLVQHYMITFTSIQ